MLQIDYNVIKGLDKYFFLSIILYRTTDDGQVYVIITK